MEIVMILDESTTFGYDEFVMMTGLNPAELSLILEAGLVTPAQETTELRFHGHAVPLARRAARLRRDFELDEDALVLILQLLERVDELEQQVGKLHAGLAPP